MKNDQSEHKETDNVDDTTENQRPKTYGQIIKALKRAVLEGHITRKQAHVFRKDLAISQGKFTRKQISAETRKRKRKLERIARRKNRYNTKGQKRAS